MKPALLLLFAGCAVRPPTPVSCGSDTCGFDQYCADVCTCCGYFPDGGVVQPSGYTECRAMPTACIGLADDPLRVCLQQHTGGWATDVEARRVSFPCA